MGRRFEREPSLTKLGVASYRERPAYSNEARLVRAIPTILSAVLLAAHFLRDGQIVVVVLCLLLPLLLIPRKLALLRVPCNTLPPGFFFFSSSHAHAGAPQIEIE